MKAFISLLAGIVFYSGTASAQLKTEFEQTKNDSLFIVHHSNEPFHVYTISRGKLSYAADHHDRELFVSPVQTVLGPFKSDSNEVYFKVVRVDSAENARIGNIWFDKKKGAEQERKLAMDVLQKADSGADFDVLCALYTNDHHPAQHCDKGSFFLDDVDVRLRNAIKEHKLNDIFFVETDNGYHLIKLLCTPKMQRKSVSFVRLIR